MANQHTKRAGDSGYVMERFLCKVSFEPMSGCWIWIGACSEHGYGYFRFDENTIKAHRASWNLFQGNIPSEKLVLHKCDIPACVNPDHLFLGTVQDNMDDMVKKGRANFRAGKMNWVLVDLLRQRHVETNASYAKLGREFGICSVMASQIIRGIKWKRHLRP